MNIACLILFVQLNPVLHCWVINQNTGTATNTYCRKRAKLDKQKQPGNLHTTLLAALPSPHQSDNLASAFTLQGSVAEPQALAVNGCHKAIPHLQADDVQLIVHLIFC